MFDPFLDGLFVFDLHKWNIALFLLVVMGSGIFVVEQLGAARGNACLKLAFSFSLGNVVFAPIALLLVVMRYAWPRVHKIASLLLLGLAFVLLIRAVWLDGKQLKRWEVIPIVLLLFLYLILRLA